MTPTVARKLFLATLSALAGVLLLVLLGQRETEAVYEGANFANVNSLPSIVVLDELRGNFLLLRLELRGHVLAFDAEDKQKAEALVQKLQAAVKDSLRKYGQDGCGGQSCVADARDADLLSQEHSVWDRYEATLDPLLAESRKGPRALDAARELLQANRPLGDKLAELIDQHIRVNGDLGLASAKEAERIKQRVVMLELGVGALVLLAIGVINFFTVRALMLQLGGEPGDAAEAAAQLAAGDLDIQLKLKAGDEHSLLARMQALVRSLSRLADRADTIGQGNFDEAVPLASERDRLGLALKEMVRLLRASRDEDRRRNWLKDGYTQISDALARDMTLDEVAERALSLIGRYLEAGRGVVYALDRSARELELLASYMYADRQRVGERYAIGEGAVGQVAKERKPIVLHVGRDEPVPIVTGTSANTPRYTYTYPLLHEEELIGVIELAGMQLFDEVQREYLGTAANMLAAALYLAEQRAHIRKMLAASEASERQLREQSDGLREANERMVRQQQQLQQQAEEMQQSNAQLEEQQQQLQQQAEEMQQTNAQLEEAQVRLEQQNRDLEQSRNLLDVRAQELDQSSQYKSEFLANMSHELRTPLNSIILLSKMMTTEDQQHVDAEARKWAQVIHRSGQDLLRLINDVLDLSKVEAGRMELHVAPVGSADLCAELRALFEPVAADKGLSFVLKDELRGDFLTDEHKLGQILRNLLTNAFKFCKQGQVSLELSRREHPTLPLCLTVRDTGIGIPQDKQRMIFEAFNQADGSTSREYGGTGLGLTISMRLAQLLGGTIELSSVPEQGSAFSLCLPEQPPVPPQSGTAYAADALRPSAPLARPGLLQRDDRDKLRDGEGAILLIDDDPSIGQALITLNRRKGYKTLLAATGEDGLQLARRFRPRGILLDLGLPDMDGAQLLHRLKTDAELARIPVYIISGRDRDDALLREGAIGFLQKPASDEGLMSAQAELMAVVARQPGSRLLVLESGSISAEEVRELLPAGRCEIVGVRDRPALQTALQGPAVALAVVDLAGLSVDEALERAALLQTAHAGTALVFYTDRALDSEAELRLRRYSDSLILKSAQAHQRLLVNIERFLNEVPRQHAELHGEVHPEAGEQALAGKHVLITDDDPRNLFVMMAALERHGAKLSTAVNGRKALDFLAQHEVDLVLMDIMMPEMDGYEALAEIRANPRWAHLPVIVITAKALPADRERILAAGADDFIVKPVDYDGLIQTVSRWISGRGR